MSNYRYSIYFIFRRQPIFFGDFIESNLDNSERRKRFWKVATKTVSKYKRANKYYQCKIRRQRKKINSVNNLLEQLRKAEKISFDQMSVLKVGSRVCKRGSSSS